MIINTCTYTCFKEVIICGVCVDIVNISDNVEFAKNAISTCIKVALEKPEKCPLNIFKGTFFSFSYSMYCL